MMAWENEGLYFANIGLSLIDGASQRVCGRVLTKNRAWSIVVVLKYHIAIENAYGLV